MLEQHVLRTVEPRMHPSYLSKPNPLSSTAMKDLRLQPLLGTLHWDVCSSLSYSGSSVSMFELACTLQNGQNHRPHHGWVGTAADFGVLPTLSGNPPECSGLVVVTLSRLGLGPFQDLEICLLQACQFSCNLRPSKKRP